MCTHIGTGIGSVCVIGPGIGSRVIGTGIGSVCRWYWYRECVSLVLV